MSLPQLPILANGESWPPSIYAAYRALQNVYESASDAIGAANLNTHRIQNYLNRLSNDTLPLLSDLNDATATLATGRDVLSGWVLCCVKAFGGVFAQLLQLQKEARGTETLNVHQLQPITVVKTGKRGRPRKVINEEFLRNAFGPTRRLNKNLVSTKIGVHWNTMRKNLKHYGIKKAYSDLTDDALDALVKGF
ncbi:hypothetical protein BKA70DRAFT_1427545 [Coprinopsis sp. MPI-PUGE-AT-0042]|nr:hypothetical protein BKA70DRAFT_1427545 [Coprinopsis sp. MPI-PUGE-AT-0042]